MSRKNTISRRDFIKEAAVGAAAVAGAGALGTLGATQASAQTQVGGLPAKWDKETDVVVIGTGCGLAAAIEAKVAGADVIIIDKADHVGGLYIAAGGSCTMGGGNIVQIRDGETNDTPEKWFQDEMWSNEYRGQPEIMRTLVERGPDTVKWLQDLGFVWAPIAAGVLRPPIKRGLQPAQSPNYMGGQGTPNSGIAWTQVMHKKVQSLGIPILLKHRMTRLYRDGTGPVVGIEVKNETGTVNIKARRGVVLATGGWTDNPRMCAAWDPRIVGPDTYGDGGIAGQAAYIESSGDGHLAAQAVGAGLADMSFVSYLYIFYGASSYWAWEPTDWTKHNIQSGKGLPFAGDGVQRAILVKNDGARFVNEAERNRAIAPGRGSYSENPELPYTAAYLALPQPRNVWAVVDADGAAALQWTVEMFKNANPKKGTLLHPELLATADTLEQLASKMGIDPAKLQATVTKYNGFVDAGKDADFGKPMPLFKLAKPPFFAAKASLIRHTQRNGVRVNTKSQVLEQSDQWDGQEAVSIDKEKVIPHLYAAGEVGDNLGWRRPHNSLGHYVTTARIAGENAAKEKPLV